MGSSLGPLFPNIIMTEMEKTIIKKFIDDKILLNLHDLKNTTNNDFGTIWIKVPYIGDRGDQLL